MYLSRSEGQLKERSTRSEYLASSVSQRCLFRQSLKAAIRDTIGEYCLAQSVRRVAVNAPMTPLFMT